MTGDNVPEPGEDLLRKALARAVAGLTATGRLVVVEVAADGMTTFEIHRDEHGTALGRRWPLQWITLTAEHGWGEEARQALLRAAGLPAPGSEVVVVSSSPESATALQALEWLREARTAQVFATTAPITGLVRDVLVGDPLCRSYDLVVMRPAGAGGRLELAGKLLFPVGARAGTRTELAVRCEPGGEHGTALAVVTRQGREPRLLSVHSARVAPGPYVVTAELVRPGRVRFAGLPGLAADRRTWEELLADLPDRLPPRTGPAHLICAVEVCGPDVKVEERLGRARQMIAFLSGAPADAPRVSLVAYGAHSFDRSVPDRPVEVVAWQAAPEAALKGLDTLEDRGAVTQGYPYHPHAAQVEDMLATVAARLNRSMSTSPPGRHVLLTIGDRRPHPMRADRSGVLPCPHRHDWRSLLAYLEHLPGMAFGAICDQPEDGPQHRIWRHLGARALAHLDALDLQGLAAGLGLAVPAAAHVPFPLLDETE
ncbi:hypothetical protein OG320_16570 [Microbispora sp. NBC_01189]|uniref:hypothetical protein n=1 Tax=Microbispora sp. NBC_01189 TaxID=2903583 RepID=UPI002E0F033A|nr:hypothetical protein OG320_16570 [Microbispora sp. NBC_01189]